MFGGNFQTWKLHSAQDYFMFFAYILAGVMVFWLIAKHMNKQRNHEKAVEKVSARLKKICGKPGEVLKNATLNLPEGKMTFDFHGSEHFWCKPAAVYLPGHGLPPLS